MTAEAVVSFAIALEGDERGKERQWEPGSEGLHWLQLELCPETEAWLLNRAGLDPTVLQALVAEGARPRVAGFDDGVVVVLRGVNRNDQAAPEDMVSVRIWLEPRRVLTITPRRLLAVEDLRGQLERGRGPRTPGELVVALTHRLADHLSPYLSALDEELDELQDRLVQGELAGFRSALAAARRRLIQFRKHLVPQREAITRLLREHRTLIGDELSEQMREAAERTTKHVEDVQAMADRATIMHDELESRLTERLNRNMHFMSAVAVLFLPLSFLTSLLGINVGGIPFADSSDGFWKVLAGLLLLALGLLALVRRLRPLQPL